MHIYIIKKDGYGIGQAKGKNMAIKSLKKHLAWEGIGLSEWKQINGRIHCITDKYLFTIEKSP